MTTNQDDIKNNPDYIPCLDKGFVGLVDNMGSDSAIVQAARVSYGAGTKTVNDDRGLIRYLVRNQHTSPMEMCQIKLHIKAPIFVIRQWVRHRTSAMNEVSLRYSEFRDEFYIPEKENIKAQSKLNKQGGDTPLSDKNAEEVQKILQKNNDYCMSNYNTLLGVGHDDLYQFDEEFDGISREQARMTIPVNGYSEYYWSQSLHNLLHLVKLRIDPHAQYEIRVFAQAVYDILSKLYPLAVEAFDDYVKDSVKFSRMEYELLVNEILFTDMNSFYKDLLYDKFENNEGNLMEKYGLSKRELQELKNKLNIGE